MGELFDLSFSYAYGKPLASAVVRSTPEDFQVDELLDIPLSGSGEHHWLHIQKRDTNTEWLARQLARLAGVTARDVGYAGMKDRIAVTTQWFSVRLPGKFDPDWQAIESDNIKLLSFGRNSAKLRRGAHNGNAFIITLRNVEGNRDSIDQRLSQLKLNGVPNYFGEQRFGHGGRNVNNGMALLKGDIRVKDRHKRSLYLSAVRSYLFNLILSARVADGSWQQLLPGEAVMLSGTNSHFSADVVDDELNRRLAEGDIHPSAPLWGRGRAASISTAFEYEQRVLAPYQDILKKMEHIGLDQSRRSLRLSVPDLSWIWQADNCLVLQFKLPVGTFATSLLREVVSPNLFDALH